MTSLRATVERIISSFFYMSISTDCFFLLYLQQIVYIYSKQIVDNSTNVNTIVYIP